MAETKRRSHRNDAEKSPNSCIDTMQNQQHLPSAAANPTTIAISSRCRAITSCCGNSGHHQSLHFIGGERLEPDVICNEAPIGHNHRQLLLQYRFLRDRIEHARSDYDLCHTQTIHRCAGDAASIARTLSTGIQPRMGNRLHIRASHDAHGA